MLKIQIYYFYHPLNSTIQHTLLYNPLHTLNTPTTLKKYKNLFQFAWSEYPAFYLNLIACLSWSCLQDLHWINGINSNHREISCKIGLQNQTKNNWCEHDYTNIKEALNAHSRKFIEIHVSWELIFILHKFWKEIDQVLEKLY